MTPGDDAAQGEDNKGIPKREELLALLNPKSPWWSGMPDAVVTRRRIIDYCIETSPEEMLAIFAELKKAGYLVPLGKDARAIPMHEHLTFIIDGEPHGLNPEGIEWLSREEGPPEAPPSDAADLLDGEVTPEGVLMLLNPSDSRWDEFEDPERMREFMTTQLLMKDADSFESMLQQCVSLGYVQARTNASGEIEYGLTEAGRLWVEQGMPPEQPSNLAGDIPPAA